LAWISLLYEIERDAKGERDPTDEETFVALRHRLRQGRSLPIFDQLHAWLDAELAKVLSKSKSPIGEAIQDAFNHCVTRKRPLEAGYLKLDNDACERSFKPVALGQKHWLFAGSDKRGGTAAILMSLCTTCKELEINPEVYLRDVLDSSTHPASRDLLPDRWKAIREASAAARGSASLSPGFFLRQEGLRAVLSAMPRRRPLTGWPKVD